MGWKKSLKAAAKRIFEAEQQIAQLEKTVQNVEMDWYEWEYDLRDEVKKLEQKEKARQDELERAKEQAEWDAAVARLDDIPPEEKEQVQILCTSTDDVKISTEREEVNSWQSGRVYLNPTNSILSHGGKDYVLRHPYRTRREVFNNRTVTYLEDYHTLFTVTERAELPKEGI